MPKQIEQVNKRVFQSKSNRHCLRSRIKPVLLQSVDPNQCHCKYSNRTSAIAAPFRAEWAPSQICIRTKSLQIPELQKSARVTSTPPLTFESKIYCTESTSKRDSPSEKLKADWRTTTAKMFASHSLRKTHCPPHHNKDQAKSRFESTTRLDAHHNLPYFLGGNMQNRKYNS